MSDRRVAPGAGWAAYAQHAREAAGLTKTELARRIGVDRMTVTRWESGRFRPDKATDVAMFARATGCPTDEALAAAGFRPGVAAPAEPSRTPDPELDRIRQSKLSPAAKARLIQRITERRQREEAQRLADLEDLIRAQERLER